MTFKRETKMKLIVLFWKFVICFLQPGSLVIGSNFQKTVGLITNGDKKERIRFESLNMDQRQDLLANLSTSVRYYYFSQSNPVIEVEIHSNNTDIIRYTAFTSNKETIFIVHGWRNCKRSDVNSHIREYILRGHDVNVFVVDWSLIAGKSYSSAQEMVQEVGKYIADFARILSWKYGLNLRKLKLVGHSLGAHVAGCVGAALNGEVDRIVGLDPAGLFFTEHYEHNRLDPTDAHFVQVIHTNDGKLGFTGNLGHADYFPNGGRYQPGCGSEYFGACSHSRAYELYAESLISNKFVAQRCKNYLEYTSGKCRGEKSIMGMFNIDTKASGSYFLDTNNEAPWAKG